MQKKAGAADDTEGPLEDAKHHSRTRTGAQTLYLWKAVPALSMGLSIRPPPAMIPTMARHLFETVFRAPEGSLMRVLPASGSWVMMVQ